MRRRDRDESDDKDERAEGQEPGEYPLDPAAAYETEPEPADETFSEQQHWVNRRER